VIGTMNLIDQSLEQIDFALRRRFLWHPSRFDHDRLRRVLEEQWAKTEVAKRFPWARIQADMEKLVERAVALNREIAQSKLLGRDYEIGHTYFFDITKLLASTERMHRKVAPSQFLWNKKGEAITPGAVRDVWRMSLEPLLDQYLQGVDADQRSAERSRLEKIFLLGQA
jgi:5-methylcytosine-specific restriction protein B